MIFWKQICNWNWFKMENCHVCGSRSHSITLHIVISAYKYNFEFIFLFMNRFSIDLKKNASNWSLSVRLWQIHLKSELIFDIKLTCHDTNWVKIVNSINKYALVHVVHGHILFFFLLITQYVTLILWQILLNNFFLWFWDLV